MTTPPHQANWVACRASCRNRDEPGSTLCSLVTITLPRQNVGAGGTGSRYPVPVNSPSALRAIRAPPRAATPRPASVDPLARLTTCRTRSRGRIAVRMALAASGLLVGVGGPGAVVGIRGPGAPLRPLPLVVLPVQPRRVGLGHDHRHRPGLAVRGHRQAQLLLA